MLIGRVKVELSALPVMLACAPTPPVLACGSQPGHADGFEAVDEREIAEDPQGPEQT
jgi:hypothetical protein